MAPLVTPGDRLPQVEENGGAFELFNMDAKHARETDVPRHIRAPFSATSHTLVASKAEWNTSVMLLE